MLGLSEKLRGFTSVMEAIQRGAETLVIVGKIAGAGSAIIFAFLLGGLVMASALAIPSYFIFLRVFRFIRSWRQQRRNRKHWKKLNP